MVEEKLVIAGSRTLRPTVKEIDLAIARFGLNPTAVGCGLAEGADKAGRVWGILRGIPVVEFPANWKDYGRSAGYRRNEQMAEWSDKALIFWDGVSRGSMHMLALMQQEEKPVHVVVTYLPDLRILM